jgi:hypothetical protein
MYGIFCEISLQTRKHRSNGYEWMEGRKSRDILTEHSTLFQWMIDALKGYGHNMTYSKYRVGGAAVQVKK